MPEGSMQLDAPPDLAHIDVPALLGALEQLRAKLWARLVRVQAPVDRDLDSSVGEQILTRSPKWQRSSSSRGVTCTTRSAGASSRPCTLESTCGFAALRSRRGSTDVRRSRLTGTACRPIV
jgi:hypothetical protein